MTPNTKMQPKLINVAKWYYRLGDLLNFIAPASFVGSIIGAILTSNLAVVVVATVVAIGFYVAGALLHMAACVIDTRNMNVVAYNARIRSRGND